MADKDVCVVRRSSEDEILERIITKSVGSPETGLVGWAYSELGVTLDIPLPIKEVREPEREELFRKFGPLRLNQELITDKPKRFAELIAEACTDAKGYAEFNGIEINASSRPKSHGAASTTYDFEASFSEMIGINGPVHKTKLAFDYVYEHDEGTHDPPTYVHEKLKDLKEDLLGKLPDTKIRVENQTLSISKRPSEKSQQ